MELSLEEFWVEILCRQPQRILGAWETLEVEEQRAVWEHLGRMVTEEGWAEQQRLAARTALRALREHGIEGGF